MKKVIITLVSLFILIVGIFWMFDIELDYDTWAIPLSATIGGIILAMLIYFFIIPKLRK